MQQFLAKPDGRHRIAGRDDRAGRSIDFGYCDGHGEHRFDGDLEVHVDDDGQHHGFDGKSDDHNRDRRMRSYQHRLSEIRLGERRDPKRSDLYGAAIGELTRNRHR